MSDEEKQIASERHPHAGLVPNVDPNHNETTHIDLEKQGNFVLTEEEAFAHAHAHPEDTTPIYIVYSVDDKDNPRNWPTWRRYYIGLFASWLNVLTCWCAGSISSGAGQIQQEFGVSGELTTLLLARRYCWLYMSWGSPLGRLCSLRYQNTLVAARCTWCLGLSSSCFSYQSPLRQTMAHWWFADSLAALLVGPL